MVATVGVNQRSEKRVEVANERASSPGVMKAVSLSRISAAIFCITSSSMLHVPVAWPGGMRNTAAGLPAKGRSAKAFTWARPLAHAESIRACVRS